jgi:hypothetical protein
LNHKPLRSPQHVFPSGQSFAGNGPHATVASRGLALSAPAAASVAESNALHAANPTRTSPPTMGTATTTRAVRPIGSRIADLILLERTKALSTASDLPKLSRVPLQ